MDIFICQTEHDTVNGTMTQFLANGVKVIADFRNKIISVLKDGEVKNSFSMKGYTGQLSFAPMAMAIKSGSEAP